MARVETLRASLAEADARRLWASQLVSECGDWAARLALAALVLQRTGSPAMTGLVTAVSMLPWVGIGQVLATLGDRISRRRVMVAADLVRAGAFAAMLLPLPVGVVLALAFVAGLATPPFTAARSALAREVVAGEQYGGFLALSQLTYQVTVVAGYVAGGGLVALAGPRVALLVNAVTFAGSALLVRGLRSGDVAHRSLTTTARLGNAVAAITGDRYIRRALALALAGMSSAMVAEALVVVYARDAAHAAAGGAGLLAACIAVGTAVAAVLVPSAGDHDRLLRAAAVVGVVGAAVAAVGFLAGPGLPLAVAPYLSVGVLLGLVLPTNVVVGTRLPAEVRASAFGLLQGVLMGGQALAAVVGGWLAGRVGVGPAAAVGLLPCLAVGLYALARPVPQPNLAREPYENRALGVPGSPVGVGATG